MGKSTGQWIAWSDRVSFSTDIFWNAGQTIQRRVAVCADSDWITPQFSDYRHCNGIMRGILLNVTAVWIALVKVLSMDRGKFDKLLYTKTHTTLLHNGHNAQRNYILSICTNIRSLYIYTRTYDSKNDKNSTAVPS